ncbi:MAG TPA: cupin domain-containing protein [Bacteroidota bacterium]
MKNSHIGCIAVILCSAIAGAQQPAAVEKRGFNSIVKYEHFLSGHLTELNGKYKFRVTETTYSPGGFIGEHHHAGPGVRLVVSGTLTYVQPDTTRVFGPGEYFYESGDVTHTAYNKTSAPVVILNFELLPAGWNGASTIPPVIKTMH